MRITGIWGDHIIPAEKIVVLSSKRPISKPKFSIILLCVKSKDTAEASCLAAPLLEKVIYNCALNPLGAILEVPYGKLGENEETREIIKGVIREIFDVMRAKGVRSHYRDSDDYYRFLMERQLPPTVGQRASMLQDITKGRKTEIDALNGAISRYAQELGIDTPYNDILTSLIKFKEKPENQGQALPEALEFSSYEEGKKAFSSFSEHN